MVRTDPSSLSGNTVARIASRGNRPGSLLCDLEKYLTGAGLRGSPNADDVRRQAGHGRHQRLAILEYWPGLSLTLIATPAVQAGRIRPVHAGRPAEALKEANDDGGDIDLPGIGAMPGAGWIGVVHVVPAFAEGEQSQRPQVGGPVVTASSERTVADHVAQRVDAPGDVLKQGDTDQPGPQQSGQGGVPATADSPAGGERQPERHGAQGGERRRDRPQSRGGYQVRGIARGRGG